MRFYAKFRMRNCFASGFEYSTLTDWVGWRSLRNRQSSLDRHPKEKFYLRSSSGLGALIHAAANMPKRDNFKIIFQEKFETHT